MCCRPSRSAFALVCSTLLRWAYAAALERSVRSGAEFAAALADQGVSTLILAENGTTLTLDDFAGLPAPIVLERDVIVLGVTPDPSRPPTLDCNRLSGVVRLGNGTHLTLRAIALARWRAMANQAPGIDLLQPMAEGEAGLLSIVDTVLHQDLCLPVEIAQAAIPGLIRPAGIPGTQKVVLPADLPSNCTNKTAGAHLLSRCYSWAGRYVDLYIVGADFAPNFSPRPNGYMVQVLQTRLLCSAVFPAECVQAFGPTGCVRFTLTQLQLSKPPPAAASLPPSPTAAQAARGTRAMTLGAAVGGALAGSMLLAALAALATWALRRNRRSKEEPQAAGPAKRLSTNAETAAAAIGGEGGDGRTRQLVAASGSPDDVSGHRHHLVPMCSSSFSPRTLVITHASPQRAQVLPDARLVRRRDSRGSGFAPGRQPVPPFGPVGALLQAAAGEASSEAAPKSGGIDREPLEGPALVTLLPQLLGRGAFGSVYAGEYQGRRVAVKVITETVIDDDQPAQQQEQQQGEQPAPADKATSSGSGDAKHSAAAAGLQQPAPDGGKKLAHEAAALPQHGSIGSGEAASARPTDSGSHSAPGSRQARAPGLGTCLSSISSAHLSRMDDRAAGAWQAPPEPPPPPSSAPGTPHVRHPRLHELLEREVEVMGRCEHPNIVRLLAACLTPPRLCLVMELMETSLQRVVYTTPARLLPLPTVLHICIQVARGLEYLHPTIMHRDLKPANVLINEADSPWPVAKLADFGLSRMRTATQPTKHPEAGTPAYLAPECYEPDQTVVTHHADMYSLGVLIWSMLTGQEPWKGLTIPAVAIKVAFLGERLPLGQLSDRRCPPQLRRIVQGCWEADPLRRPAAAEVAKALEMLQQSFGMVPALHQPAHVLHNDAAAPRISSGSAVHPLTPGFQPLAVGHLTDARRELHDWASTNQHTRLTSSVFIEDSILAGREEHDSFVIQGDARIADEDAMLAQLGGRPTMTERELHDQLASVTLVLE